MAIWLCVVFRRAFQAGLAVALAGFPAGQVSAQDEKPKACFDAEVFARIVGQTPSIIPKSDDESIVMEWPWFLDLDVKRVIGGGAPTGKITILSVQHTYWMSNLGTKRWRLRRNDQGTFNLLSHSDEADLKRCPAGTAPAAAYLRPGRGHTLLQERDDGEKRYGRRP